MSIDRKKPLIFSLTIVVAIVVFFSSCENPLDSGTQDTTPEPSVSITYPANGVQINTTTVDLSGTTSIESPGSIESVEARVGDGQWQQAILEDTNWSITIKLHEGLNQIVARASSDGNITTNTPIWYVTVNLEAPAIEISSHQNNDEVYTESVRLSGTASANSPHTIDFVDVQVNSGEREEAVFSDGSWYLDILLEEGSNSVQARAVSTNGKSMTTPSMQIIRASDEPTVTISSHEDKSDLLNADITLSGSAVIDEQYSITDVQVKLNEENWENAQLTESFWELPVVLDPGYNTIVVRATGSNGKTGFSESLELRYLTAVFVSSNGVHDNDGLTSDAPLISIQDAISKAEGAGLNEIRVAAGTYMPDAGLNYSGSGIFITTSDIVITGGWTEDFSLRDGYSLLNGQSNLTRIIHLQESSNVEIDGFELSGGSAFSSWGGAMFIEGGSGNSVTDIIARDSSARYGGGIAIDGGENHTVTGDVSSNESDYGGGGVYLNNGQGHALNLVIEDNVIPESKYGGGVYVEGGSDHVIEGSISGHTAYYGGGIYIHEGINITVRSNTNGNTAEMGGGMYVSNGTGHMIDADISNNLANRWGGGVYFSGGIDHVISSMSTISSNHANEGLGGGVFISSGDGFLVGGNIESNFVSAMDTDIASQYFIYVPEVPGSYGGGVFVDDGENIEIDGTIKNNEVVTAGSGVYLHKGIGHILSETSLIESNVVSAASGPNASAVYVHAGSGHQLLGTVTGHSTRGVYIGGKSGISPEWPESHFLNGTVSHNHYTNDGSMGGGVLIGSGSGHQVNGVIHGNTITSSVSGNGGGIAVTASEVSISAEIYDNQSSGNGGGVHMRGTLNQITTQAVIRNNNSSVGGGVAVQTTAGEPNTIEGTIKDNTADEDGGGVWLNGSGTTLNATIQNNSAVNRGGGVFIPYTAGNNTIGGIITSNSVGAGGKGGGIYAVSPMASFDSEVSNNSASIGGGIYFYIEPYYELEDDFMFLDGAAIYGNSEYGLAREIEENGGVSEPSGMENISWNTGNTPGNIEWH